ncbi:hypothetical protein [Mucilaginibacter terrae]|uniref:DNA methylase N-4/N-6 domain-containing protein n=1 Tax=Mucilaginibacter terrae TaxID=1955052 RepID=A0ABU3GNB0_9SPHI|nr:hypothetical protein [Mucilaginibacter terrae]MDT3401268.1 hypothetical protein [Mucilaginibacter terrae]
MTGRYNVLRLERYAVNLIAGYKAIFLIDRHHCGYAFIQLLIDEGLSRLLFKPANLTGFNSGQVLLRRYLYPSCLIFYMIIFDHIRCPLHRYTFRLKPIRNWVERTCEGRVLNLFAGYTLLNVDETRNDLDPEAPAGLHLDALELLRTWKGAKFNTILLDPPYAYRKSMELYKGIVCSPFKQLKDTLADCLEPGGIVITFGYHSIVMGRTRNFTLERLALFSHGGAIHDTIASVERLAVDGMDDKAARSNFLP